MELPWSALEAAVNRCQIWFVHAFLADARCPGRRSGLGPDSVAMAVVRLLETRRRGHRFVACDRSGQHLLGHRRGVVCSFGLPRQTHAVAVDVAERTMEFLSTGYGVVAMHPCGMCVKPPDVAATHQRNARCIEPRVHHFGGGNGTP